jgi:tetratricopeptide (TPR) repeat protein
MKRVVGWCIAVWAVAVAAGAAPRATWGDGLGARNAALGGAVIAWGDDAGAAQGNPALLERVPAGEVLFQHAAGLFGRTEDAAALALPRWTRRGRVTWGALLARSATEAFDVREGDVVVARARPWRGAAALSLAASRGGVSWGGAVRGIRRELLDDAAGSVAVDVGVVGGRRLLWGASLCDFGPPLRWAGEREALPRVARAGVGGTGGRTRWGLSADLPARGSTILRGGVEGLLAAGLALRAGTASLAERPRPADGWLTLGVGWRRDPIRVDYAFRAGGELADFHRVDVTWRFSPPLAQEARRREWLDRGRDALAAGRVVDAQAAVDELFALCPRDGATRALAARIHRRYEETLDPETLFTLGHAALGEGELERAAGFFRTLLAVQPDHAAAQRELARAETGLSEARQADARRDVAEARRREGRRWAAWARDDMRRGRWAAALDKWRRAATVLPESDVREGRALCRERLLAQAVRARDAGDEAALRAAVEALEGAGETGGELAALRTELNRRRQDGAQKRFDEGLRAYGAGRRDEARRLFREARDAWPENPAIRRALERVEAELAGEKR